MNNKNKFIWGFYFALFTLIVFKKAAAFLTPGTPIHLYFYILYIFDWAFIINYFFNFTSILLNLIHLFPLGFFILDKKIFKPILWKYLFVMRIVFDLNGNSYEIFAITSIFRDDPWTAAFILLRTIMFYIPSYIACYYYAFK